MPAITHFWGPYSWLSNFHLLPGCGHWTTEHLFQAAKTHDPIQGEAILNANTPGEAKRLGRRCTLRADWEVVKEQVMLELVRQKFEDPDLRRRLLGTGALRLEEGNTWGDRYWGVDARTGEGLNRLGEILMQVRAELQQEEP